MAEPNKAADDCISNFAAFARDVARNPPAFAIGERAGAELVRRMRLLAADLARRADVFEATRKLDLRGAPVALKAALSWLLIEVGTDENDCGALSLGSHIYANAVESVIGLLQRDTRKPGE